MIRRRITEAAAVASAAAVVTGIVLALSLGASNAGLPSGPNARAGAPRFYVQQSFPSGGQPQPVIRATATGNVTATIRCPWPHAKQGLHGIAATSGQVFFLPCDRITQDGTRFTVTGLRVYRFGLTSSGQITGYTLVPGGMLGAHWLEGITAAADGSQIAVSVGPPLVPGKLSPVPAEVIVINTRTGAHAVWHGGAKVLRVADLTFTNGGGLAFIGLQRCALQRTGTACEQLRAVPSAAAGGQLDNSRLLLPLSAIKLPPSSKINNNIVISPDGSTLIAPVTTSPRKLHASDTISVIEYSASTGKQLRVLYQMRTGNGFFYRFLSSDPSGRYLILNAGPTSGTVNGWIHHGQLAPLKPANGSNLVYETW